ncbi:hypothetical protein GWI34_17305 [Actinomadura sp. DSM 109109]|nr:hypothetical protein [Actinomadura lepetitiana]
MLGESVSGAGVTGRSADGVGVFGAGGGAAGRFEGTVEVSGPLRVDAIAPMAADVLQVQKGLRVDGAITTPQLAGTSVDDTPVVGTSSNGTGVQGVSTTGRGVHGTSTGGPGVHGVSTSNAGVVAESTNSVGVRARSEKSNAVLAVSTDQTGVIGISTNGTAVRGQSNNGHGVHGINTGPGTTGAGVLGQSTNGAGVRGLSSSEYGAGVEGAGTYGPGIQGTSTYGPAVWGKSQSQDGVTGVSAQGVGVRGASTSNVGVLGSSTSSYGVWGSSGPSGYAGFFTDRVHVTGTLTQGGGGFKIDHPLDPANRYLTHSFVESPEMKNVYDGVSTLDAEGQATVELPAWFEALNRDYRYQLTPLGGAAPHLHISRELAENGFAIAGGEPRMRVSWQVTGVRRDAWSGLHPVNVEEDKPAGERGYYLHPEAHGQPAERAVARLGEPGESAIPVP